MIQVVFSLAILPCFLTKHCRLKMLKPDSLWALPPLLLSGLVTQRRDSLSGLSDYKQRQLAHYYGSLAGSTSPAGPVGLVQPGQSLTPPQSLSGSATNLSLGGTWRRQKWPKRENHTTDCLLGNSAFRMVLKCGGACSELVFNLS